MSEYRLETEEDMSAYPDIEYRERVLAYKKHKNGKEVKDEHGYREVDWDKTTYKKKRIQFDDSADIIFWVGN